MIVNAVGIETDGGVEIVDVSELPPAEIARLAFHDPALLPEPATMDEERLATAAGNQSALEVYASQPCMHDPKLRRRLCRLTRRVPVLGEEDGALPTAYGRLYADSFPDARFRTAPKAGYMPHIEQSDLTIDAIKAFMSGR
ncbi:hypothetical protein J7E95_41190 [Streptomyces sp. ISL-14]|nr:hypothetical protein [Streptomyces sp. ISL-14]